MKKQCCCCRQWKPLLEFHRDGVNSRGTQKFKPNCKVCTLAKLRAKTAETTYRPPIILSSPEAVWLTRKL